MGKRAAVTSIDALTNRFSVPDWPPSCEGNPEIKEDEFTYLGTAEALIDAGVLRPEDTPGQPECPRQWGRWGVCNGVRFGAVRLGPNIFVYFYGDG